MAELPHRQLLVRCTILNGEEQSSVRFVERNHFRMWQYLMANKHHIRITSAGISLWLPEREWQHQAQIFTQSGRVEPVNRLNLAVYDGETGLCNTTQRYVPQDDAPMLQELLLERLLPAKKANGDYHLDWEPGMAILQSESKDLSQIGKLLGDQFAVKDELERL